MEHEKPVGLRYLLVKKGPYGEDKAECVVSQRLGKHFEPLLPLLGWRVSGVMGRAEELCKEPSSKVILYQNSIF